MVRVPASPPLPIRPLAGRPEAPLLRRPPSPNLLAPPPPPEPSPRPPLLISLLAGSSTHVPEKSGFSSPINDQLRPTISIIEIVIVALVSIHASLLTTVNRQVDARGRSPPSAPGLLFRQSLPEAANSNEAKSDPFREQTRLIATGKINLPIRFSMTSRRQDRRRTVHASSADAP